MGGAGGAISAGVPASPPGLQISRQMLSRALPALGSGCDNVPPMHRGSAQGRGVGGTLLGVVLNNVDLKHDQNYYYYTNYYGYYSTQGTKETHRRGRRERSRVPSNGADNGHFEPDEY